MTGRPRHPFAQPTTAPIESVDTHQAKARKLPLSGPGIVVTVPLGLLPEYLNLNHLEPMSRGEVRDLLTATGEPKRQVLYVKRVRQA